MVPQLHKNVRGAAQSIETMHDIGNPISVRDQRNTTHLYFIFKYFSLLKYSFFHTQQNKALTKNIQQIMSKTKTQI